MSVTERVDCINYYDKAPFALGEVTIQIGLKAVFFVRRDISLFLGMGPWLLFSSHLSELAVEPGGNRIELLLTYYGSQYNYDQDQNNSAHT